jgi:RND family efflux transporter MFP subunit
MNPVAMFRLTFTSVVLANAAILNAAGDDSSPAAVVAGQLAPHENVVLQSRIEGAVTRIQFEPGERVEKGDLLFQLDARMPELELARLKAQLQVFQAQFSHQVAQRQRMENLLAQGSVSSDELEKAVSKFGELKAKLQHAEASVELGELRLSHCQMHAPISGYAGQSEVAASSVVRAGQPLVTIVSCDPINVLFDVDQETFLRLRETVEDKQDFRRLPVAIDVPGMAAAKYDGRITFIDNKFDPATGTVRFVAVVDNSEGRLLPGMRVKVQLALSIP